MLASTMKSISFSGGQSGLTGKLKIVKLFGSFRLSNSCLFSLTSFQSNANVSNFPLSLVLDLLCYSFVFSSFGFVEKQEFLHLIGICGDMSQFVIVDLENGFRHLEPYHFEGTHERNMGIRNDTHGDDWDVRVVGSENGFRAFRAVCIPF